MTETTSHKRAKAQAAGRGGEQEVPIRGGQRLDALSPSGRATEVERSGAPELLERAARRLKASGSRQRVLQVPQPDMTKAVAAMRKVSVAGTVKNMGGTKRRSV